MDATSLLLKQNARVAAAAVQFRAALEHFEVIVGGHRQPFTDKTRQKTQFLQQINWVRFIEDYKDRPFFCRHMRMVLQFILCSSLACVQQDQPG